MKRLGIFTLLILIFSVPACHRPSLGNFHTAQRLFETEEYKQAIGHLKKVTAEEPSNTAAWVLLGDAYGRLGKHKDAVEAYQRAIRNSPSHERAIFKLGLTYSKLDRHREAIVALNRVVELNPSDAEAHFYLGVSYDKVNSVGQAFEQYKILKTLDERLATRLYHIIFW